MNGRRIGETTVSTSGDGWSAAVEAKASALAQAIADNTPVPPTPPVG